MQWEVKQTVDLLHPRPTADFIAAQTSVGDIGALKWSVNVQNATMTGYSVRVDAVRPDGNTVVTAGAISGTVCSCTLAKETFAYTGQVTAVMRLYKSDNSMVTIGAICFYVRDGVVGGVVDPGRVMTDLATLEEECEAFDERLGAIERSTTAITLSSIQNLYISATEPSGAANGSLWLDTSVEVS